MEKMPKFAIERFELVTWEIKKITSAKCHLTTCGSLVYMHIRLYIYTYLLIFYILEIN